MSLEDCKFTGTKTDQVKQIGNAVPAGTAEALCKVLLNWGEWGGEERRGEDKFYHLSV